MFATVAARLLVVTIAALVLLAAGLVASDAGDPDLESLLGEYRVAVVDAADPRPDEIVPTLIAIVPGEPRLRWDGGRVLVVAWTDSEDFDGRVGERLRLEREAWVTAAPEVQEFCSRLSPGSDRVLRLEQWLGLPPRDGRTRFVELWVDPGTLFRPAPDPEIDDRTAGLEFPAGVAERHVGWIERLRAPSAALPPRAWTQLGYTYDWAADGDGVGASEFVVRVQSEVEVHAVTPTDAYCTRSDAS